MSELITRRACLSLCAATATGLGLGLGSPLAALAQAPKTLKLVVPFSAGGTADVLPRILSEKLRPGYPGGVLIENRVGAGGNIGGEYVFRADPDGTTLLASPPGPIAINHNLYAKMGFDPTKWVPVTVMATVPNVLAVRKDFPARSLKEFIAYLKANPGKVSFASQGNGTTSHLTAAMFMQLTGTEMLHIPYKGTAPALNDLLGGQVDIFFDNIASSAQYHQSGQLQVLAVTDEQRSKVLPQVPTFAESGLPGMVAVTFFAIMAPPGTPDATVDSLNKQFADALAQPDVRQRFADQGAEARGWSAAQTGRFVQAETERWAKVIKSANVTLN